jgi:hypothetical protein
VQKIEYTDVKKMHEMDNFETRNHSLIPYIGKTFSLLHCVLSSSRAHPAAYAMVTGAFYLAEKQLSMMLTTYST